MGWLWKEQFVEAVERRVGFVLGPTTWNDSEFG